MESAIKKAIEGGYAPCEFTPYTEVILQRKGTGLWGEWVWLSNAEGESCGFDISKIVLDPKFWQALGKAEGWKSLNLFKEPGHIEIFEWMMHWHRFIDHLAEGKPAEEFFEELLK